MPFFIRLFDQEDRDFVLAMLPRLSEVDLPPWCTQAALDDFNLAAMKKAMDDIPEDAALLVAEDEGQVPAGFIYLTTESDYFSGEKLGYISDLAVAPQAEGQGVGRLLISAAEDWTREMGYRRLTLDVFAGNERARRVYEKAGFLPAVVKYAKPID
jgi:GNAT superfamily N-acetyltransferase